MIEPTSNKYEFIFKDYIETIIKDDGGEDIDINIAEKIKGNDGDSL